ncbi:hypothetical protein AURDEDRAFT_181791 [Auricularia subglabra TFB-10046 SS5]|nr:hypothetical protein AURDEDRAFT_181791 [Auricularia subglabra TFB-10046 SS5]
MSFNISSIRRQLILDEERELERLNASEAQLQRTLSDALHAFEQARQGVTEVQLAIHDVQARRIAATNRILGLRRTAATILMQRMPPELLRFIFDGLLPPDPTYSPNPHRIPSTASRDVFSVAAVSSRWRSIALSYPQLWSYLQLGGFVARAADVEYVQLLLERSRTGPFHVSIHWINVALWTHGGHLIANRILELLIQNAARWRQFEGVFSSGTPTGLSSVWKVFAPNLEYFSLTMAHNGMVSHDWDVAHPMTPAAPQLKMLVYLGPDGLQPNPTGVSPTKLTTLLFRPGHARAWDVVHASMRTLEVLHVQMRNPPDFHSVNRLVMPQLHTLVLSTSDDKAIGVCNAMQTPRLRRLRLSVDLLRPGLQPFLNQAAASVDTLHLWGRSTAMILPMLHILRNVERLTFGKELEESEDTYSITSNFFVQIAKTTAPTECVLPKLHSLVFTNVGQFEDSDGEGFLKFLRSRNPLPPVARPNGPRRIREIELNAKRIPPWLPAEVKRLVDG